LDERAAVVKDARSKAFAEVAKAKERVAAELEAAKKEIELSASQLAGEIAARVLEVPPAPGSRTKEAR
jgi:hypothetical protein